MRELCQTGYKRDRKGVGDGEAKGRESDRGALAWNRLDFQFVSTTFWPPTKPLCPPSACTRCAKGGSVPPFNCTPLPVIFHGITSDLWLLFHCGHCVRSSAHVPLQKCLTSHPASPGPNQSAQPREGGSLATSRAPRLTPRAKPALTCGDSVAAPAKCTGTPNGVSE